MELSNEMCIRDSGKITLVNGRNTLDANAIGIGGEDRKSTRLNSSHVKRYRMPSSA